MFVRKLMILSYLLDSCSILSEENGKSLRGLTFFVSGVMEHMSRAELTKTNGSTSWRTANKKQREKLLELIRRLAEDDKDGVMAHKTLAHSDEVPTEIMDPALNARVKILDYSCSQERDAQKTIWLDKCVEELKNGDKWALLPALKQIREICCLYEPNPNLGHS